MATVVIINPKVPEPFVRLLGALKNPKRALKRIGFLLKAGAQKAFHDQAFGSWKWPARYPNQGEPFINTAGALSDFAAGKDKPKPNRLNNRPAVRDTSYLMGSINDEIVDEFTVAVGTTVPYAAQHQHGLVSTQPVTTDTKKRIAAYLLTPGGEKFRDKLLPMLKPALTNWDTEIVQRPFLGVTDVMEGDIQSSVEELIAEEANGGNA